MTLNEITTLLAAPVNRQFDMPYKKMLAEHVKMWRSRLIHDSIAKKPKEARHFLQAVYLRVTKEDLVICGETIPGCPVFKSEKLPERVRGLLNTYYIGSVDGKKPFRESAPGLLHYAAMGIQQVPSVAIMDNYVALDRYVPVILVYHVFADPEEAMQAGCNPDGSEKKCDTWNEQYPMSGDMEQMVMQYIRQDFKYPTQTQEVHEVKP